MKMLNVAALTVALVICSMGDALAVRFITIGTGGVTGVYYPAGGAISKFMNRKKDVYNLRVTVESTGGSVFNVNAIMAGDLEFGIVQSDRQYQAYNGLNEWENNPQKKLRAVFSIHTESVTLVAAKDAGIETIADLKGKKVNIGNPGSGQRSNSIDALTAADINYEMDLTAESIKPAGAPSVLQDGKIDAFFYTVGHPNKSIKEATTGARKVNFVEIPADIVKKLIEKYSYYAPSTIPAKFYPNAANDSDVETFGVTATFCTSIDIPEEIVYNITKEVLENLDAFKDLHPAFGVLTKESMVQGLSAPLHPGAAKYYKEIGLL